jgi:hypothetical protein
MTMEITCLNIDDMDEIDFMNAIWPYGWELNVMDELIMWMKFNNKIMVILIH